MPPKTKPTKRSATTKAGTAASAPVAHRFIPNGATPLDEVAELLLYALNNAGPTRAPFVYRVEKRGHALHGIEIGIDAKTRAEADNLASARAKRTECRLRFVREQRAQKGA